MRQPVQVLIYPAHRAGGDWRYLLLRRVPDRGGFWQGVTGGLEEGEALTDAAMRELNEETGLLPSSLLAIGFSYAFPLRKELRSVFPGGVEEIVEHVFAAVVDTEQAPILSAEHDRWEWCTCERARQLLVYPENVEALERCDDYLKGKASNA